MERIVDIVEHDGRERERVADLTRQLAAVEEKLKESSDLRLEQMNLQLNIGEIKHALAGSAHKKVELGLEIVLQERASPVRAIRQGLEGLREPLVKLVVADQVRSRLLCEGDRLNSEQQSLYGGRIVVAQFLEAIPPRLRPRSLYADPIEDEAHAYVEELLTLILP